MKEHSLLIARVATDICVVF